MSWFKTLKVGDSVVIAGSGPLRGECEIQKVARILKTKIVLDNGHEFVESAGGDGVRRGDHDYFKTFIYEVTDDFKNKIAINKTRRAIVKNLESISRSLKVESSTATGQDLKILTETLIKTNEILSLWGQP